MEPLNILEEAIIFQWLGVGADYLKRYPLQLDDVVEQLQHSGAALRKRLPKMSQLLLGESLRLSRPIMAHQLKGQHDVIALQWADGPETIVAPWRQVPADPLATFIHGAAITDLAQNAAYFLLHRMPLSRLGDFFETGGTLLQLWHQKERPPNLHLYFEWMPNEMRLRTLAVSDMAPDKWVPKYKGPWHSRVSFRWNLERMRYEPASAPGIHAMSIVTKWFQGIDVSVDHPLNWRHSMVFRSTRVLSIDTDHTRDAG